MFILEKKKRLKINDLSIYFKKLGKEYQIIFKYCSWKKNKE